MHMEDSRLIDIALRVGMIMYNKEGPSMTRKQLLTQKTIQTTLQKGSRKSFLNLYTNLTFPPAVTTPVHCIKFSLFGPRSCRCTLSRWSMGLRSRLLSSHSGHSFELRWWWPRHFFVTVATSKDYIRIGLHTEHVAICRICEAEMPFKNNTTNSIFD